MNDGPLQLLLILCWCWHLSQQFLVFQLQANFSRSLPSVNALYHLWMLYAICEWSYHAKFYFGKPLSTERSFPLSIFLISRKISQCNIVPSKHSFSCLHNDTKSGNTHYLNMLTSFAFFFFLSQTKQTPFLSHFLCFQTLNTTPIFVGFFLHLSFSRQRDTHNCFHKTSCNMRSVWHKDICRCL